MLIERCLKYRNQKVLRYWESVAQLKAEKAVINHVTMVLSTTLMKSANFVCLSFSKNTKWYHLHKKATETSHNTLGHQIQWLSRRAL